MPIQRTQTRHWDAPKSPTSYIQTKKCIGFCTILVLALALLLSQLGFLDPSHSQISLLSKGIENPFVVEHHKELEQFQHLPTGEIKATIIWAHGYVEHCSRGGYQRFFERLATEQGFAVHCLNHQGHGNSYGEHGYVERFDHYIDDFSSWSKSVIAERSDSHTPVFLFGHSMGSMVALQTLHRNPDLFDAIGVSGLATKPDPAKATPFLIAVTSLLSDWIPKLPVDDLNGNVSRNQTANTLYEADPFCGGQVRVRFGAEFLKAGEFLRNHMADFSQSIAFFHGASDAICSPSAAEEFYAGVSSSDKKLFMYEGMEHEPFEDPDFEQFYGDLVAWFSAHL